MRKAGYMYCRSFYTRKDGTMYVQVGHDRVREDFLNSKGKPVYIPMPNHRLLVGLHVDTKKCGIILSDWSIVSIG